jgi:hypothetical protein
LVHNKRARRLPELVGRGHDGRIGSLTVPQQGCGEDKVHVGHQARQQVAAPARRVMPEALYYFIAERN